MNQFLFSPTKQFIYPSGKILVGGKIYVFIKHTNTLARLFNDEGVEIANPVVLDSNGRATVLANEDYDYKLDVYTSDDELLFTAASYMTDQYERDLAIISTDGSVSITPSISGYTDVWDLSVSGAVSGKFDTSAFERFYNDTYGPTVGDIYHKINDISATVSGGYDSKLDVTAFNLYSAGVRGDLNVITGNTASISYNTAMLDDKILQNTNNINSVSGGLNTLYNIVIPEIRTDIIDVSSKVDSVSAKVANKLDSTAFDDFISNSYSPNMSTIFSDIGSLKSNKFDSSAFTAFINDSYGPNMSTIYQGLGNLSANKEDKITWAYNNNGEISAANGSALAGKGYYSKYAPYGVQATSGNLIIEGSRYPRQSLLEVSGENNVATAGIIPPVPEQNLSAVRYLVAASGSLADVSWKELPQIDTFSGVTTDSTLTGDGKNDPLGVAEVQSLSSDESISITSGVDSVILGVNSSWFDNAVNSAYTGSQGTTYSSVSGTVIVSGNDLEISSPAIKSGVPWEVGGWAHSYDDSTAFNAGFPKNYNSYRLEHIMYNRQYPNPAHTGFSAELRQIDENYNILSSTMLYGIFDFEFTPVPNCDMIWLYCSGTSAECQRGVTDYYRTGNHTQWLENLAWENDTPTRNEFANLYENIAVNSGVWSNPGTSLTGDAQGAVDEVYANSGNWEDCYNYVSSNSGSFTGDYISAGGFNQSITGNNGKLISFYNVTANDTTQPAFYLSGTHGSAYYKENELKLNRAGHQIAFNIGGGGPSITAAATTTRDSKIWLYNTKNSGCYCQSGINYTNSTANETVDIPSIQRWNSYSAKQDALTYTFVEI